MKYHMFDKNDNFRPQKRRLNTNTARKKTKKVNIGGRAIAAEACM